ncbi:MAG: MBL fold metallo-hydrolase [Chloroflexi bacterium]|nr:MBL fold metallo-hydrolase [Chloroflexota bacterium]
MEIARDAAIRITKFVLGQWDTNAYLLTDLQTGESALFDAPGDPAGLTEALRGTHLRYILLTHSHRDHTGALPGLKPLGAPLAGHAADAPGLAVPPDILLDDGDTIRLGAVAIEVLHTPGHTPGSLCFRAGSHLLCGDTVFPGGPGKTATPDDFSRIRQTIERKLLVLPDDTALYPGHGGGATIAQVRREYAVFTSRPHAPELCGDVLWLSS